MKKLLILLLSITMVGCALDDDSGYCPDQEQRVRAIREHYEGLLDNEDLTEEERTAIQGRYRTALQDPCSWSNQ